MYDVILRNDLINLNKTQNINDLHFNRNEMRRLISCRTQDKLSLLKFLLSCDAIDYECYQECVKHTENDFKLATKYSLGLCNI